MILQELLNFERIVKKQFNKYTERNPEFIPYLDKICRWNTRKCLNQYLRKKRYNEPFRHSEFFRNESENLIFYIKLELAGTKIKKDEV
jgi:hypothetical protein